MIDFGKFAQLSLYGRRKPMSGEMLGHVDLVGSEHALVFPLEEPDVEPDPGVLASFLGRAAELAITKAVTSIDDEGHRKGGAYHVLIVREPEDS